VRNLKERYILSYNINYPYSDKTQEMFDYLPSWMEMAKEKESSAQQFMNFFGLKFEEMDEILEELLNNRILVTNSTEQPDIIYKIDLPSIYIESSEVEIKGAGRILEEKNELKEFYNTDDSYIIDTEKNIAYIRNSYGGEDTGKVNVSIYNKSELVFEEEIELRVHHVWNSLDEFGLLLNLPRNHNEDNVSYKKRLLNVFRYLPNSTKSGLTYGISNSLELIKTIEWPNDDVAIEIQGTQILKSTIKVNGKNVEEENITKLDNDRYKIDPVNTGSESIVTYICGVELHSLSDKKDEKFQNQLYKTNKTATNKLKYYVNRITDDIPIMWGSFLWDRGWWDPAEKNLFGIDFLPSIWDPNVENWKYFEEDEKQPLDVEGMEHFMFSSYWDESQYNGRLGFNKGKLYGIPVGEFTFSDDGGKTDYDLTSGFDKGELTDTEVEEFSFSDDIAEVQYSMKKGFNYGYFREED